MAWVARAATPIATIARSAVGSGRTADRNWSARARSTTRRTAWPRGVSRSVFWRRSSSSALRSTRRRLTSPSMSRLVADGDRLIDSASSPTVSVLPSARTYRAASWVNPRRSSPSWLAKPITSSRHSARPIATRSLIWRTLRIRLPAARTGAERSCSKRRAIVRAGAGRLIGRAGRSSRMTRAAYGARRNACNPARESGRRREVPSTLRPMTKFAFVFPGQGSQTVGMGRDLAVSSPAAAAVFAAADAALGEPLSALAWEGPAERLDLTENAQPALLAASIAILEGLRERWAADGLAAPNPAFAAGHSMGQYSALVAAGALSLEDGVRLVRERGRLMQASGQGRDGAMAALIGLDDARLRELVAAAAAHGTFVVANRNAPGQVVVSGDRAAIEAGATLARDLGAKRAIVLPVSVAAHSPLMAEAAEAMRETLAGIEFHDPTTTLLANADGRPITTADGARAELVEHLTAGVDWVGAVGHMIEAGVTTFVEIGPGKVLTGLIKRIAPDAEIVPADDPGSIDRLTALAARAA